MKGSNKIALHINENNSNSLYFKKWNLICTNSSNYKLSVTEAKADHLHISISPLKQAAWADHNSFSSKSTFNQALVSNMWTFFIVLVSVNVNIAFWGMFFEIQILSCKPKFCHNIQFKLYSSMFIGWVLKRMQRLSSDTVCSSFWPCCFFSTTQI